MNFHKVILLISHLLSYYTLLFCSNSSHLIAITLETNKILDIHTLINAQNDKETIFVLFDIDDTLLDSPISLNSGPWISYYWKHAPKLLPEKMDVIEELMWYITKTLPTIPVDSLTASIISECQTNPAVVPLAFTARPIYKKKIDGIKVTSNQLLQVNIDFTKSAYSKHISDHPSFHSGIIYTSSKMKGDFLHQFITATKYHPGRIVFIDDKLDQIQSVEKAMKDAGIKIDCIWYRRALENRPTFNLQLANVQLEYFLKEKLVLSDHEAALLLSQEKYISTPPETLFKQLIELYERIYFNPVH